MIYAYMAVGFIGFVSAFSEIVSRYRDDPWEAASSRAAFAYIAFNVGISLIAFYLIREVFQYRGADQTLDTARQLVTDVLLAGLSAMAFFRSSIFTARVGDKDVPVGPAAVIDVFREIIDRDVDRVRAMPRATAVSEIMANVSFSRAYVPLTSTCLNLLQNVSVEERTRVEEKVLALSNQVGRNEENKSLELGLILAGTVGFNVLKAAKDTLKDHIASSTSRTQLVKDAVLSLGPEMVMTQLPTTCLALDSNLPDGEQEALASELETLRDQSQDPPIIKAIHAGFLLTHYLGEEVFSSAVSLLGELNVPPTQALPTPDAVDP
ncbi:hypothetical protein [uncultured Tateyamaria sp.]|uniref:hypothetical protein n=1 Tax=uncultured Tateyamaria sp. TaxID=455651 RepID=UPI002615E51F|nr:hypothetical protein [uncultured Tateyamaria sp.]